MNEITVTWRTTTYGLDRSTSTARRPLSCAWIESARAFRVIDAPLAPRLEQFDVAWFGKNQQIRQADRGCRQHDDHDQPLREHRNDTTDDQA